MSTLKRVLLVNALSSGATGLLLLLLPGFVAGIFEVPQNVPFKQVGIFLTGFALLALVVANTNPPNQVGVKAIIVVDCLWVFVSLVTVIFKVFNVSVAGNILILAVAAWVGLMVFLQYSSFKKHAAK